MGETRPSSIWRVSETTLLAVLLVVLVACGDDGKPDGASGKAAASASATPSPAGGEPGTAPRYTREQVIEALEVTRGRDENGVMNSDLRTGCFASKIFVGPEDNMAAYIQIGDPVATNPSGEIGVAVGTYAGVSESKCRRIFERRLAKLT